MEATLLGNCFVIGCLWIVNVLIHQDQHEFVSQEGCNFIRRLTDRIIDACHCEWLDTPCQLNAKMLRLQSIFTTIDLHFVCLIHTEELVLIFLERLTIFFIHLVELGTNSFVVQSQLLFCAIMASHNFFCSLVRVI